MSCGKRKFDVATALAVVEEKGNQQQQEEKEEKGVVVAEAEEKQNAEENAEEDAEKDWKCSICLNSREEAEQNNNGEGNGGVISLSCAHSFCGNCIQIWLARNNLCPVCKTVQHGADEGISEGGEQNQSLPFFVQTYAPGIEETDLDYMGMPLSVEQFEEWAADVKSEMTERIFGSSRVSVANRRIACPFPRCSVRVRGSKWHEHAELAHCVVECDRCFLPVENHLLRRHQRSDRCAELVRAFANTSSLELDWFSQQQQQQQQGEQQPIVEAVAN